ncbi:hypothetical protein T492DRAFT_849858 [Pavlovales sp. CCMP2436]|nr:hypothetical protein T492DRAFT_849858 [Pavlovales sp. CCMP2436]
MASHLTKQLLPALHRMAGGGLAPEEEAALTRYLQAHMHVAQALLFKAYAEATSALRKAVARTLVLLWTRALSPGNTTRKDKSVVTWEHVKAFLKAPDDPLAPSGNSWPPTPPTGGPDACTPPTTPQSFSGDQPLGAGREQGALLFFSSREDMEAHFAWLCACVSGVGEGKAVASRRTSSIGGGGGAGMPRTLSNKVRFLFILFLLRNCLCLAVALDSA